MKAEMLKGVLQLIKLVALDGVFLKSYNIKECQLLFRGLFDLYVINFNFESQKFVKCSF